MKTVSASNIVMAQDALVLELNEAIKLCAIVKPLNTKDKSLEWMSDAPSIVSVDELGNITALKSGRAIITAKTINNIKASCEVTVKKEEVKDLRAYELKSILLDAEFPWVCTTKIDNDVTANRLLGLDFTSDGELYVECSTNEVKNGVIVPINSSYEIGIREDKLILTLDTNIGLIEPRIQIGTSATLGGQMPIRLEVKEYTKDKIVLYFDTYRGFEKEVILTKATEKINFSSKREMRKKLGAERSRLHKEFINSNPSFSTSDLKEYLTLYITKGVKDATVENPVTAGFSFSTWTSTVDIVYNDADNLIGYCAILVYTSNGFVSGISMNIGGKSISCFKYNEHLNRFEIDEEGIEGHFGYSALPPYAREGVTYDFLNHYSLWMNGFSSDALMSLKSDITRKSTCSVDVDVKDENIDDAEVKSENRDFDIVDFYFVTKYQQRNRILNEFNEPIYSSDNKLDYTKGDNIGNGLLFSFDSYYQFSYYFVPLNMIPEGEDRIRFERAEDLDTKCRILNIENTSKIKSFFDNNANIKKFIDKICNKSGFLLVKSELPNVFEFDFRFIESPLEVINTKNQ
ncbi:MAG: Ig-like domain-containing protein [Arcobacteraceae bacterium]